MQNRYLVFVIIITIVCYAGNLFAAIKTIEESCEYVMGDNDTKLDAKRLCLIEGKRKILEKVGTYIESDTTVRNFSLTQDEIKTYATGLIKTVIVSEQMTFNGQNTVMHMNIKADVDTSIFEAKMMEIHKDKKLSAKYSKMAEDYKKIERQIRELQNKLKMDSDSASVAKARIKREKAFSQLSALEKVKENIKQKTSLAVQNVEIGMTEKEVISLVGAPRSKSFPYDHLNYGNIWVIMKDGIVRLLVDARCYSGYDYGSYFDSTNPCGAGQGIIKQ